MGKQLKNIKKKKRDETVSAYGQKTYETGYQRGHEAGVKESFNSFIAKVNELRELEELKDDKELFDKIIHTLNLKGLV